MINSLAIANYRSILKLVVPLNGLNLVTGANGSGKSNLYRALRLLAETAQGGVIHALAREGGLQSTFWAGPETVSRGMMNQSEPVQGGPRQKRVRLRLGFSTDEFSYAISLGLPTPSRSAFALDPEIKQEAIWVGSSYRPASALIERKGNVLKVREGRSWHVLTHSLNNFESLFSQVADPERTPEVISLRESIRGWRFYDHFRTDQNALCRQAQLGTRTVALHHDGRDLAAAVQTILEIGDAEAFQVAVNDAFPGAKVNILIQPDGRFILEFQQQGLLRPLSAAELSDGTLRYLLLITALLTPRLPPVMIFNEPETSLHPDLLPALARLIIQVSQSTQVWVVSHADSLITALQSDQNCQLLQLHKQLGQSQLIGQTLFDEPLWRWPDQAK